MTLDKKALYTAAAAAVAAGFHINPFCAKKTSPLPSGFLAEHTPDEVDEETLRLIKSGKATGFGVAVGPRGVFERDGELFLPVVLEFEGRAATDEGWLARWETAVQEFECGDVMERLADGMVDVSPSGGVHWSAIVPVPGDVEDLPALIDSLPAVKVVRFEDAEPGSDAQPVDPDAKTAKTMAELLVTSRGVITAPSGGPTHPSGEPWVRKSGDFADIPRLDWADLFRLSEVLASLNEVAMPGANDIAAPMDSRTARAAALINKAATTLQAQLLLERHGWSVTKTHADGRMWMAKDGHAEVIIGNPKLPDGSAWAWGESFPLGSQRVIRFAELRAHFEHDGDMVRLTEEALASGEIRLRVWALSPSRRPDVVVPSTETTEIAETVANAMVHAKHRAIKGTPFVLAKQGADGAFAGFASVTASTEVRHWMTGDDLAVLATSVAQPLKAIKTVIDRETGEERTVKTFDHSFPKSAVKMALETAEGSVSPVRHIAPAPLLLPTGKVLAEPGYHRDDRALVAIPASQRQWWKTYDVPERLSQKDAQRALDWLLREVLADFPYATAHDRARGVIYVLTCVSRNLYGNCPGFLFSAPDRGSGKDLHAEIGRRLANGTPACQFISADASQTERSIVTALVQGNVFIHNPEIPRDKVWKDNVLQAALTGDSSISMRILGGNTLALLIGRIFTACGNNAQLGSDLLRRFLEIRLEWGGDGMPEDRSGFRHANLPLWVTANRPRILAACHTILAYGLQALAGTEYSGQSMGTFEGWVQVVLGSASLVKIDEEDVASLAWGDRRAWSQSQDDEGADWVDLMRAWRDLYGEQWVQTSKACAEITGMSPAPALPAPLVQQVGAGPAGMARVWGIALKSRARTRVRDGEDTLLFEVKEDPKRGNKFRVVTSAALATVTPLSTPFEVPEQPLVAGPVKSASKAPARKRATATTKPANVQPVRTSTRGRHTQVIDLGESA